MARTLADMTPEEREQCRGMWCEYHTLRDGVELLIYRWEKDGMASVHDPKIGDGRTNQFVMVRRLIPRFDMPRAWEPDGTPVEMDIETRHVEYGRVQGGDIDRVNFPEGTEVHRFVGDWEARNE